MDLIRQIFQCDFIRIMFLDIFHDRPDPFHIPSAFFSFFSADFHMFKNTSPYLQKFNLHLQFHGGRAFLIQNPDLLDPFQNLILPVFFRFQQNGCQRRIF